MKKRLLLSLTALATALSINAQTINSPKSSINFDRRVEKAKSKGSTGVEKQVTGSLTCNTQYVAGTTMDLSFTLELTNTDAEYCDLFTLTFPAGITPNTSANNTDPFNPTAPATGQTASQLNAISGQSISWGTDDDAAQWGGIETGVAYTFVVNVTIAGGTTGNLVADFTADGDTYATNSGDLSGTTIIYPVGATIVDVTVTETSPEILAAYTNCGLGTSAIIAVVKNIGNASVSNVPVGYSVNGGTAISEVVAGPIAAGDSVIYTFTATADFTAQNLYDLKAWSAMTADVSALNDTASIVFTNSDPVQLTSTVYTNGFESDYDFAACSMDWIGIGTGFGLSSATINSGALALYLTIGTVNPAADYESHAVLPCMDVVAGETYRISYYRKANDSPVANGMTGIFAGTAQTATDMTTVVKAYSAITPNAQAGAWEKDSADYLATTTGTMYFSIGGKGTVSSTSQVNVRIDDIKIEKIVPSTSVLTMTCPASQTTNSAVTTVVPDLTSTVTTNTTCSTAGVTVTQSPVAGSALTVGANVITFTATDNCSNTQTCTATITYSMSTLGLNENVFAGLTMYPNPATDVLNINANEVISSVSVITTEGKVVSSQVVNNVATNVNVAGLTSGIYMCKIVGANGAIVTTRFVKK